MCLYLNARKVREGGGVGADDRPGGSSRSGGDDQVVRPARSSLVSDMNEQLGVDLRDRTVVVEHRDDRQDVVKEGQACRSLLSRGQEHTDSQLRHRDGGDRRLVVVAHSIVEFGWGAFRVDQERGVKEEPGQGRSSMAVISDISIR